MPAFDEVRAPEQSIVDRQIRALPYAVRIDSLGYRGVDFPRKKVPGELRVLAIGDSFTYGDFVDDGQTVPAVVQRQLERACGRPVTVVNAGVGGSTITTQIEMLRRAAAISPGLSVALSGLGVSVAPDAAESAVSGA